MPRVTVLGAGAWGTALALQALRAGNETTLVARDPGRIAAVNPRLPGVALPDALCVTGVPPDQADAVLIAVPTQGLGAALSALPPGPPLLLCCKGVEQGTQRLPLEIAGAHQPGRAAAILSGPNFAAEIARGLPAAAVLAAADAGLCEGLIALLATPGFRLYANLDAVGVQLGGAAKNVIAIACGTVVGAGLGENARAALITRGLAELGRLVAQEGGEARTVAGLSGLGDLVLTCTGPASRNFSLGLALGQGADPATLTGPGAALAEGALTAPALLARAGTLDLPICTATAALLAGRIGVREAVDALLARPLRRE